MFWDGGITKMIQMSCFLNTKIYKRFVKLNGNYIFMRPKLLLDYFLPLLGNKRHIFAPPCSILYEYQDDTEDDDDIILD